MTGRLAPETSEAASVAPAEADAPKEDEADDLIEVAIALLRKGRRSDLQRAAALLEQTGPRGIERLLDEVKAEADKRRERRRPRWVIKYGLIALAGYIALIALVHLALGEKAKYTMGGITNAFIIPIVSALALSQFQLNAGRALSHLGDPRAVGQLAELLDGSDRKTRRLVVDALTRLMPKLEPERRDLLDERHRRHIARAMVRKDQPDFTRAAIEALDRIGDAECVESVRLIATGQAAVSNDEAVRAVAEAALPGFERRAQAARLAATLLRPAEAPGEEMLLRPAHGPDETPEAMLVRPAEPGTSSDTGRC